MKSIVQRIFLPSLFLAAGLWTLAHPAQAEDRLYFTAMVEENLATSQPQVLLAWGALENALPDELTGFRLYRKQAPGDFTLLGEVSRALASPATLAAYFDEAGEEYRFAKLEEFALDSSGGASGMGSLNVATYVNGILSLGPEDEDYNPLQQRYLVRFDINIARGVGQAYIDRTVSSPGVYEYMLTGLVDDQETLPLGQTMVDTSSESILPEPTGFAQSFVGGCTAISRNLDDRQIHFVWDVPVAPEFLNLRVLTYGFDIYRSDTNLGAIDLRSLDLMGGLPATLDKINRSPIVPSGPAPASGRDRFLAKDEGNLSTFDFLQRGKTYFYYLVARDLSGKYSGTAGPLEATVPDVMAPPPPWNFHPEEIKDPTMTNVPRIQLVWDEITGPNWIREYGHGRTIVPPPSYGRAGEIYYTPSNLPMTSANRSDVDLEVAEYHLFRFEDQAHAQSWGVDSDGDLYPDNIEEASGTDPCDDTSHPPGAPPELVRTIPVSDSSSLRTLSNGTVQRFVIDNDPMPDNKIHWYRLIAVDSFGNQSPLTPPVRAVLWDRTQPVPDAEITREICIYRVERDPNCFFTSGVKFKFSDDTREARAAYVRLYERCTNQDGEEFRFVIEVPMNDRLAGLTPAPLEEAVNCRSLCADSARGFYIVRYYDADGNLIASSEVFSTELCNVNMPECFVLREECRERPVNPGEPLDPEEPIHICINLCVGERARIYHELNGEMSPFLIVEATHDVGCMDYCIDFDLPGIVPHEGCLGVRVFSKNNVGSYMLYLNCLKLPGGSKPDAPLLHSADPTGTEGSPNFSVRWAAQSEGLSAFVLAWQSDSEVRYETYWINSPDISYSNGLYEVVLPLNPATDLGREWCFKVRAIDQILQSSDYSVTLCSTWEPGEPEQLPWPPVPETPEGNEILAYFLNTPEYPQPFLVLSDPLNEIIDPQRCSFPVRDCRPQSGEEFPCLGPIDFNCSGICDLLKAANKYGEFIVYRQELGQDFVQVSPLIDTFFCYQTTEQSDLGPFFKSDHLDDPWIYLIQPIQAFIFPVSIRPEVAGLRLVFADNYPCKRGTTVRYQVMQIDPVTGEGIAMHYSDFIEIP